MRKTISTVLATTLLIVGLWVCWEWFAALDHADAGGRTLKFAFLIGPTLVIVGSLWLASDWFDL